MGYPVKQGSTARPLLFLMTDSADHLTGKTGLTVTVTLSKNGAAFAAPAGAVSELSSGWYRVAGNATDNNTLGVLLLHATAAAADPTDDVYEVVVYDPADAVRFGLTALPNANAGASGGLPTGNASGQVAVSGFAADAINAASIAPDAGVEIASAVWASGSRTLTSLSALAGDLAGGVWNAVATSYNTALSMGNKLNAAGSAGDPWTTAVPGAYGSGTAGNIVGNNLNATISSRASQTSLDTLDDLVDTEVAAIKLKTDTIPASPAAVGSAMTLDLTQSVSDVGGALNTLGGILAGLRAHVNGRLTIVSGVLKLFGQNGSTQVGVDRTISGTVPTDATRQ